MKKLIVLLIVFGLFAASANAVNIVSDPSFETGGGLWQFTTHFSQPSTIVANGDPIMAGKTAPDGTHVGAVYYEMDGSGWSGAIYQDITTGFANGDVLDFSYKIAAGQQNAGDAVLAVWLQELVNDGSGGIASLQNPKSLWEREINQSDGWYTEADPAGKNGGFNNQIHVQNVGPNAGDVLGYRLEFRVWAIADQTPGHYAYGLVDDVAVTPGQPQPIIPYLCETSLGGDTDWALNRMWDVYGRVVDGAVNRWGNEPAYFEWMALKLMWSGEETDKGTLRYKLRQHPCSAEGYLWSWGNEEGWPTHHARHYENNGKYILAVWRYYVWTGNSSFLSAVDTTTATSIFPSQIDASNGMTVLEKTRLAMQYQLVQMNGEDGLIQIDDPDNDGTLDSKPGDYWDNYLFGYKSAYNNIYFYASLIAMADLEDSLGNTTDRDYYLALADTVKTNFNNTFWDASKGRFIGCIDIDGVEWDFGFTYLNMEAIHYGLVDANRAEIIYEWLDGERIVSSDYQLVDGIWKGSTGSDIYALNWAPRSNTRAMESIEVGGQYWWWDIGDAIRVGGENPNADWAQHQTNGGSIFWISFYDLMSRWRMKGADDAWNRYTGIIDEFLIDELRRDPGNTSGAAWKWGIIGEFPESGLVPTAFIYGMMGISIDHTALYIEPQLPSSFDWSQAVGITYHGTEYEIQAYRGNNGSVRKLQISTPSAGSNHNFVVGNLVPNAIYTVEINSETIDLKANIEGCISLNNISAENVVLSLAGDVKPDGKIDMEDVAKLSQYWLHFEPSVDIYPKPNGDGINNFLDFSIIAQNWLRGK